MGVWLGSQAVAPCRVRERSRRLPLSSGHLARAGGLGRASTAAQRCIRCFAISTPRPASFLPSDRTRGALLEPVTPVFQQGSTHGAGAVHARCLLATGRPWNVVLLPRCVDAWNLSACQWFIYPPVIDPALMRRARVRCNFRRPSPVPLASLWMSRTPAWHCQWRPIVTNDLVRVPVIECYLLLGTGEMW